MSQLYKRSAAVYRSSNRLRQHQVQRASAAFSVFRKSLFVQVSNRRNFRITSKPRRSCDSKMTSKLVNGLSYVCQEDAIQIDEELFKTFTVDVLMELAGLACAQAIENEFRNRNIKILIIAGPGNNGGDGLVAARHLSHCGFRQIDILYPKQPQGKQLFTNLVAQMNQLNINVKKDIGDIHLDGYDVYIDAIFGFSFKGWRGEGKDHPFDSVVRYFKTIEDGGENLKYAEDGVGNGANGNSKPQQNLTSASTNLHERGQKVGITKFVVSIDIPSGWTIDANPAGSAAIDGAPECFSPHMLISLTAPKLGSLVFNGVHYVGGRFVPPDILSKFKLVLPEYPNSAQVGRIANL